MERWILQTSNGKSLRPSYHQIAFGPIGAVVHGRIGELPLNGILWILSTGAPWKDFPKRYGAYQTVHRRFQNWVRSKVLEQVLLAVAQDLKERGGLDLSATFVDGSFAPAKKGGCVWERLNAQRAPRSWPLQTAMAFLSPSAQRVLARLK